MKRKIAWLALPLVLCVLLLGVKWRAEHPTPTPEDLEIRALMRQADHVEVAEMLTSSTSKPLGFLSRNEISLLADNFCGLPSDHSIQWGPDTIIIKFLYRTPTRNGTRGIDVITSSDGDANFLDIYFPEVTRNFIAAKVHPATMKRWLELLKANPRIGPELRARMKQ